MAEEYTPLVDYPDYTQEFAISAVLVDMIPVSIKAQTIDKIRIDIVAQSIGNISVDIAAQTVGNLTVDIAAQSVGNLAVDIAAQSLSTIAISINAADVTGDIPIDIAAQTLTNVSVDIAAQTLSTIKIDIAAQTLSQVDVNIAASAATVNVQITGSTVTLDIDINAQSVSVNIAKEWAAKQDQHYNAVSQSSVGAGSTLNLVTIIISSGNVLYIDDIVVGGDGRARWRLYDGGTTYWYAHTPANGSFRDGLEVPIKLSAGTYYLEVENLEASAEVFSCRIGARYTS